MVICSDSSFKKWIILKDSELKKISIIFKEHYSKVCSNRINNRMKYIYVLCNDFNFRYKDLCNETNLNKENSKIKDSRCINRGRNIKNFSNKKKLIEIFIYSLCFDNLENELTHIDGFKKITSKNIINLNKNNTAEITTLMKHILKVITNDNLEEYCYKRPNQSFLLYSLLNSLPHLLKMTKPKIIEKWKNYLFKYNLIIFL